VRDVIVCRCFFLLLLLDLNEVYECVAITKMFETLVTGIKSDDGLSTGIHICRCGCYSSVP
jgi:hypothetical protein